MAADRPDEQLLLDSTPATPDGPRDLLTDRDAAADRARAIGGVGPLLRPAGHPSGSPNPGRAPRHRDTRVSAVPDTAFDPTGNTVARAFAADAEAHRGIYVRPGAGPARTRLRLAVSAIPRRIADHRSTPAEDDPRLPPRMIDSITELPAVFAPASVRS